MMEKKEVYEGEVVEITPFEADGVNFGYGKTISHVELVLKTSKGSKKLKLDPSIYDDLLKQKVEVGDVIYIDARSATVKVCVIILTSLMSLFSVLDDLTFSRLNLTLMRMFMCRCRKVMFKKCVMSFSIARCMILTLLMQTPSQLKVTHLLFSTN
jgi:hypothetical protein